MRCLFALLSFVATACAYTVLTPGNAAGWTTAGTNTVTWQRVDSDAATFTLVLVNQDKKVLPATQVLAATVDGTKGTLNVNPPSGGFPAGAGFQINFVKDAQNLDAILAQSQQFAIAQSSTTAAASSTAATATDSTAQTTNSTGGLSPTSTSASKNGAGRTTAAGSTGLIFAALAAIAL
ncbi:Ser-Thr-rich glycosyl-phosphatidyl-inositol-anchored membrane family-domain-containing protein [Lactifluus subvellereus]|nr:Ser-Thr-rich glycosyl-phosphatidyl-inositol-anchored membrane family-domain-containing protein [Lactifluus subvellereus]